MIGSLLKTLVGSLGLGGLLSSGWLIAGAVAAALAVLGGVWLSGYNYANALGEAAALRLEQARLNAVIEEKDRQVAAVNRIQMADANRARALSERIKELEEKDVEIVCDPAPSPPAAGVREQRPAAAGGGNGQHSANPARRRIVRPGGDGAGSTPDRKRGQPPLELGPNGAR